MRTTSELALSAAKRLKRGYWPILKWAARRDPGLQDYPMLCEHEILLRADFRESVYLPFLRDGCIPHQRPLDRLFAATLRPGDLVVDVGANIGYTTLLAARLVGPSGRVIAFEPAARMAVLLRRSTDQASNVEVRQCAIGAGEGRTTFYEANFGDLSSVLPVEGAVHYDVPLSTLDSQLHGLPSPTLVKIDVEGFEPEVIAGMGRVGQADTAPLVIFEALTNSALDRCRDAFKAFLPTYTRIYRLGDSGPSSDLTDERLTHDFLAVPTARELWFTGLLEGLSRPSLT